jgi:hypothetical protein
VRWRVNGIKGGWDEEVRDLERYTGDLRTRLAFSVFHKEPFDELILFAVPQDLNVKPGPATSDMKYPHKPHLVIGKADREILGLPLGGGELLDSNLTLRWLFGVWVLTESFICKFSAMVDAFECCRNRK